MSPSHMRCWSLGHDSLHCAVLSKERRLSGVVAGQMCRGQARVEACGCCKMRTQPRGAQGPAAGWMGKPGWRCLPPTSGCHGQEVAQ